MLEVISRDDAGKPDDAVRVANELVSNEKVDILAGTYFSHIGLAVSDYALRSKKVFVAAEPLTDAITWDKGNRYTFRLRPSTYMQAAMLVDRAAALPAKRWATVAPNYEYGQSAVAVFKELLKARSGRTSSSSASSGRPKARSTPDRPCRRWRRPSRKPSST